MKRLTPRPPLHQMERGSKSNRRGLQAVAVMVLSVFHVLSCTSGSDMDARNGDFFSEAQRLNYAAFTTTPVAFNGSIQGLVGDINALGVNTEQAYAGSNATIEGIVTIPADYGIALGTSDTGCDTTDLVFQRSFVLQDANSAVLVAYGKEPPSQNPSDSASAQYILNSRNLNMAVMGDRLRITVTKVQKYGSGANVTPVVTDFSVSTAAVVSTRNSIPFAQQSTAAYFSRTADMLRVRRLEGYVTESPAYVECASGQQRQFQFNYQKSYGGKICVGATSLADAASCPTACSGSKCTYKFQLSKNLGAGTLSGFDTGDSFSYNLKKNAKVRMTGPIFPPQFNQTDAELMLMLDQRAQVESLP